MILIDTSVISETLKQTCEPNVIAWFDQQPLETLYLSTISLSELWLGVEILPKGKRKEGLSADLAEVLSRIFDSRVLSFDQSAAIAFASIVAKARGAGKVVQIPDAQIAAIAHVHGFNVATRDTMPFIDLGVPVINPWLKP